MAALYLMEFKELMLKSHDDFQADFDIVFSSSLKQHMKTHVVLQPEDWPC